jgi:hypothetical protein
MLITITAQYNILFTWTAEFTDPQTLTISINVNTVLEGTETLKIKLMNWQTFTGIYGG